jgi:hypothetical protein
MQHTHLLLVSTITPNITFLLVAPAVFCEVPYREWCNVIFWFNTLQPSGNYMYHLLKESANLHFCICGFSQNTSIYKTPHKSSVEAIAAGWVTMLIRRHAMQPAVPDRSWHRELAAWKCALTEGHSLISAQWQENLRNKTKQLIGERQRPLVPTFDNLGLLYQRWWTTH